MNNDVRNILMNEFGLTRESVRQETLDIVGSVVRSYLDNLLKSGYLEKLIRAEINGLCTDRRAVWRSDETPMQSVVKQVAQDEMREFIKTHISVEYRP